MEEEIVEAEELVEEQSIATTNVKGPRPAELKGSDETSEAAVEINILTEDNRIAESQSSGACDNREKVDQSVAHVSLEAQVGYMQIAANAANSATTSSNEPAVSSSRTRSPSATSISSEEVILFGGRSGTGRKSRVVETATSRKVPNPQPFPKTALNPLTPAWEPNQVLPVDPRPSSFMINSVGQAETASGNVGPLSTPSQSSSFGRVLQKVGRREGPRSSRRPETDSEEEAIIQDYINNMVVDESLADEGVPHLEGTSRIEHRRSGNGARETNASVRIPDRRNITKRERDIQLGDGMEGSSANLDDFNSLSTTDDDIVEVRKVFSQRQRSSGFQYLVIGQGQDAREARWVLRDKLVSDTAIEQIRIFRDEQHHKFWQENTEESTDFSGEEAIRDDLDDDMASESEDNRRLVERTSRMTDEQIARALAKQEELGMGGDKIMLFDGQEGVDDQEEKEENKFTTGTDFIPFNLQNKFPSRRRSKPSGHGKDCFPPAEAFADALDEDPYNGFDVMDHERPSLRPRRRGRKSAELLLELESEDAELAFQLQNQWSTDRAKKSLRKREREELRRSGLLGPRAVNGRVDLHTKYADSGMDAVQVKAEVRSFLCQDTAALALAPMSAHDRASVHRLAKALKLKSHSNGSGNDRFAILTKTPQTPQYTADTIWEIDALMNLRKFFPHQSGSHKSRSTRGSLLARTNPARRSAGPRGGGDILAGASYMDGEIVGASAPAIGSDNRGRAILEKMGWSSGMGIGKEGNKGSTDVIKHVVKNSRAGLG